MLARYTWDLPDLTIGTNLQANIAGLFLITAHIRDLRRLVEPNEVDDLGSEILEEYLTRLSVKLAKALELAQGALEDMSTVLQSTPASEFENSVALAEAAQLLIELQNLVLSSKDFTGKFNLTLDEIGEWSDRLAQAQQRALFCSQDWTAYVIERSSKS